MLPKVRESWACRVAFLLYVVLVARILPEHEPWFDEAQAWLFARDVSPFDMITLYTRYEGTPPLWHLLLMIPAKLGLPYGSMNVLSALFSAAGVGLLVFRSPLPLVVRLVLPFTYFLLYQYAVVARSYCLLLPLLMLLAVTRPTWRARPALFFGLATLLGYVSMHGYVIAAGIVGAQAVHLFGSRQDLSGREVRGNLLGLGWFGVFTGLLVLQQLPPPDLTFPGAETHLALRRGLDVAKQYLTNSLSDSAAVAWGVTVLALVFFASSRVLLFYLLPVTGLLLLFAVKYANVWHEGTLVVTWIFALWLAYGEGDAPPSARLVKLRHVMTGAVLVVAANQIDWSWRTYRDDLNHDYSAARRTAAYLEESGLAAKRVAALGFSSHAILPYFDRNIFVNYNGGRRPAFWLWSRTAPLWDEPEAIAREQPDVVVVGLKDGWGLGHEKVPGYDVDRGFEGALFWKRALHENDSYMILRRAAP